MATNKNKGGRPRKEIDQHNFENLCAMQATKGEICDFFDVTDKTLTAWCKRTYQDEDGNPMGFSDVYAQKKSKGAISLRRMQWRLAEKNVAMAIFLGKNYLGQSDTANVNVGLYEETIDPLSQSFIDEAEKLEKLRDKR